MAFHGDRHRCSGSVQTALGPPRPLCADVGTSRVCSQNGECDFAGTCVETRRGRGSGERKRVTYASKNTERRTVETCYTGVTGRTPETNGILVNKRALVRDYITLLSYVYSFVCHMERLGLTAIKSILILILDSSTPTGISLLRSRLTSRALW